MMAFFKGKSLASKAIMLRTFGQYSHAAWVKPDGTIYESIHKKDPITGHNGPRKGVIGDMHKTGTEVVLCSVLMQPDVNQRFIAELEDCIKRGVRYDRRGLFGWFVFHKSQSDADNYMFCSDYLMHSANRAGFKFLDDVPSWAVSPSHLSTTPLKKHIGSYFTGKEWVAPNLELCYY